MLAVVQPYSASPADVGHRTLSSASSRSASSNLASIHPPSLQRHQTIPSANPPPRRTPTPPLKPSTPTPPSLSTPDIPFDIHSYPPANLLKLLALLLTHIATTNDHLSPTTTTSSPNHPLSALNPIDVPPIWHTLTTASRGAVSTSAATLTFHARNIPTISLEAYLLRILKYCPTTNHVFLSLLVYFDRMSKLSEDAVGRAFVIDSYNIHRLVIAGVTVASKFFSDVFYTNSRYAKVGGLPLPELNQLELQFLLLNDFRLVISSTEMQHYAEQLILFSKSSTPSALPNFHLPLPSNGHLNHNLIPNPNSTQPSQPHAVITAPSSTSITGSNSSRTITAASFKKQSHETEGPVSQQPSAIHPPSSFTSACKLSSFPGAPKRPLDALGGVSTPILANTSAYHPQTHAPVSLYSHHRLNVSPHPSLSNLNSHSSSHPDPHSLLHYRSQPQLHSQSQQQQHHHNHHERQLQLHPSHRNPQVASSSSAPSQDMDEADPDTDTEDADTSTDAGTETDGGSETDEEPTIKAPPTVAGSVGSGASVGGGSVWGDEGDERMGSP